MMKKKIVTVSILLVIGIVALIIGSFYDYQITDTLCHKDNLLSIIVASISELPAYGGLAFAGGALIYLVMKLTKIKLITIPVTVFCVVVSILSAYKCGDAVVDISGWGAIFPNMYNAFFIALFGIVLVVPCFFIGIYMAKKSDNPLLILDVIGILLICGGATSSSMLFKLVFHRPRYRWLIQTDPDLFCNWWESFSNYKDYIVDDGFNIRAQFESLPSGHAILTPCLAAILYYLPGFDKRIKINPIVAIVVGYIYGIFVCFTRLLAGAHFLSDLAIGYLIILLGSILIEVIVALLKNYFNKKVVTNENPSSES